MYCEFALFMKFAELIEFQLQTLQIVLYGVILLYKFAKFVYLLV